MGHKLASDEKNFDIKDKPKRDHVIFCSLNEKEQLKMSLFCKNALI